jgi:hypothetical protein
LPLNGISQPPIGDFNALSTLAPTSLPGTYGTECFLAWQNRPQESLAEMARAKQLDPFSSIVNGMAMTPLLSSRQYDRTIDSVFESLPSNPNDPLLDVAPCFGLRTKGRSRQSDR